MKRITLSLFIMLIAISGWALGSHSTSSWQALLTNQKDSIDCTVFTVGYDYKVNTTDKEGNTIDTPTAPTLSMASPYHGLQKEELSINH